MLPGMRRKLGLLLAALTAMTATVVVTTASPALAAVPADGYYKILNDLSGQCLDQDYTGGTPNQPVLAWPCNGGANQVWRKLGGDDYFVFINSRSQQCLNQDYSNNKEHSNVIAYGCHEFPNEQWNVWWDTGRGAWVLANGLSGKCLDQDYSGGTPHHDVLAYTCKPNSQLDGVTNQHWFFIRIS
jgi:hypothetical protein